MQMYIDTGRQGKSEIRRPAGLAFLFHWIDKNGPAPDIQLRFVSVDVLESVAVVHLEWKVGQERSMVPEPACRTYSHC
jgi:hypothetical protein